VTVVIRLAEKAEVDKMWLFVGEKHEPRWRWHMLDHRSSHVLAHVFGCRKDTEFLKRKVLLELCGITRYYIPALGVGSHDIAMPMRTSRANATRSRSSGSL
jgi:hypothetical protein